MSAKLILYFTAGGHSLYRWEGGALALDAHFAADEQGLADFRGRMAGAKGALVYVLADLAGEDFHEDQIPYLRGGDRQAVLDRRLAQRYRDTRLAAALSLGQAGGERRNERLLLASFTNTQQFTAWLDALAESGARLSGVYSIPLLAPALAARLGIRGGRALVVTVNTAGLRQCFIEDGRLRFARLERTPELKADALAAFVQAETLRLVQYLSTLRMLPRDGPPVQAIVVVPAAHRAAFEQVLISDTRIAFVTTDMDAAVKKAGIKRPPAGTGEQLYLNLLVRNPPKDQFARGDDRRSYFLWRLQFMIVRAALVGFALCVLYAGYLGFDIYSLSSQTESQMREAREATQQYERITASFPVTQTTTDNLKATVIEFTKIASQSPSLEPALVYLSQVVDKFPQMEIESILWRVGKPDAKESAAAPAGNVPPAAGAPGSGAGDSSADQMQMIEVSGRVNAVKRSDYRALTAQVQQFAEAMRSDKSWRVLRTQLPFDVTSDGVLSGDMGSTEGNEAPRFSVTVGRGLK
jgi:hypothetical protein